MKKELVISAYQRDYGWIKYLNSSVDVTVYRKGNKIEGSNEVFIERNVGQDVHTFFYHIVKNYDNLADYTFFSQDFPFDHVGNYIDIVNGDIKYWDLIAKMKVYDYYAFSTASALNWEPHMPKEAYTGKTLICKQDGAPHHRPHELNIATLWPQIFESSVPETFEFVPAGHFCISKQQLRTRTKKFYSNIVNLLETRHLCPYEIERLEPYIFNPKVK